MIVVLIPPVMLLMVIGLTVVIVSRWKAVQIELVGGETRPRLRAAIKAGILLLALGTLLFILFVIGTMVMPPEAEV